MTTAPPSMALLTDQLDVWLLRTDTSFDEPLLDRYAQLLPVAEREQVARFHFAKDRYRALLTRALVRDVLSRYAPIAPADWRFAENDYGKPFILNADPIARRIFFNISHTAGLIMLGVIAERAIGLDTENVSRAAPLDIAEHFFSASETEALRRLPLELQQQRFFQLWTLKESYIKARGMGLSIPLDQFSFHLDTENEICFALTLDDEAARWCFWQWSPSPDHIAALCLERTHGAQIVLRMRELLPLMQARELGFHILRSSPGAHAGVVDTL